MAYPALSIQQPDLGRTLATVASLKNSQIQNKLLEYKMGRDKELTGLRGKLFGGDSAQPDVSGALESGGGPTPQAAADLDSQQTGMSVDSDLMKRYLTLDPKGGAQIISAVEKMNETQRKEFEKKQNIIGGLTYQLQTLPPEQRPMVYPQMLAKAQEMGVDTSRAPQQYDPTWVQNTMAAAFGGKDYAQMLDRERKEPLVKIMTAKGPKFIKQSEAAGKTPHDEQLVEVADPNSPTGTRYVPRTEAAGMPGKPPSGLNVEFGADGRPTSITTGRQAGGMGKKAEGDIETRLFNAKEGLARLDQIAQSFKPEYQTFETQIGTAWTALKEKAGREIDPEDRNLLSDFSAYRRDAINNINLYIKEITGAQMSEKEAGRIREGMPDPGEGLVDGDSPTQFQAKMRSTIADLRKATARYTYALKNGLDPQDSGVTLNGIQDIMKKRQDEIVEEERAKNPDIAEDDLVPVVRERLAQEFGLQ